MRATPRAQRAAAAVLTMLVALLGVGCDKQSSCRPGTIFVQVDVASYITANQVDIDVAVQGGTPVHTQLHFPAGTRAGGVEVQFPNGYPTGKKVDLTLSLSAGSGPTLATRTAQIVATGDCTAITIDFGADGGMGGGGGNGGAGGRGGGGGAAGSVGGSAGGTAGTGGSAAGASGSGGTGGSAAGTGGGAAGRGGAGGTVGTGGGAAGRGGTGGTGGGCVATGAENCFNNIDDDCDGRIDCADTDCGPVAQCVPLDVTGGRAGVMVAASTPCPTGFTDQTTIYSGISAGSCTGCSCRPPGITCTATISSYMSAAECGTASNAGTLETTFSSTLPCTTPSWKGATIGGSIYGVQAGAFTPTLSGACVPVGAATLSPVTWGTTSRFCATATVGGGCASGQACIPVTSSPKCAMFDGTHACQAGTTSGSWYTGATDSRTCSACSCGNPTGQSCAGMTLNVGTDYSCGTITAMVASGQRFCYPAAGSGVYSPGLIFSGTPTQPTSCPASSTASGFVTPTGPKTTCCLP